MRTDVGIKRKNNEDSILVKENKLDHKIFIVADGMGGHNAGDVASKMACELIGNEFSQIDKEIDYQKFITKKMAKANAKKNKTILFIALKKFDFIQMYVNNGKKVTREHKLLLNGQKKLPHR